MNKSIILGSALRYLFLAIVFVLVPIYWAHAYIFQLVFGLTYLAVMGGYFTSLFSNSGNIIFFIDHFFPGFFVLTFLIHKILPKHSNSTQDDVLESFEIEPQIFKKDENLQERMGVSDFVSHMKYGDRALKLRVMEEVAKGPKTDMIELLQIGMEDSEYEVRYFANNLILKFEAEIIEAIKMVNDRLSKNPSQGELYLKRAKLFEKLAHLNQQETHSYLSYLNKAQEDYLLSMTMIGPSDDLYIKIISLFAKQGKHELVLRYHGILQKMNLGVAQSPILDDILNEARFQIENGST